MIFVFSACKESAQQSIPITTIVSKSDTISTLKLAIIGKWGTAETPVWKFTIDSICYLDSNSTYPYELKGDTLSVKFAERDSFTPFGTIYVNEDTLILKQYYRDNFTIRTYRYKN